MPRIIFDLVCNRESIFTTLMKLNKNIKIFLNYFLGPLLFAWLSYSIYRQIRNQTNLEESWNAIRNSFSSPELFLLLAVVLFMVVNWSIEALKWRLSVLQVQPVSFLKAFRAVMSGVSFSVTTPNRTGEYLGRVLYMNEGNRLKVISLTILSSISQLIITVILGTAGLFLLKSRIVESAFSGSSTWVNLVITGGVLVSFLLILFYFKLTWFVKWIERIRWVKKYSWLISELEKINTGLLLKLLALSGLRFSIFGIQYYLVFQFYGIEIDWWQGFWAIAVVFFIMAVIPGIALFEVVQKIYVTREIVGLFTLNTLGIGLATTTIWFINLMIPAAIGSLMILGLKLFKKENENTEPDIVV